MEAVFLYTVVCKYALEMASNGVSGQGRPVRFAEYQVPTTLPRFPDPSPLGILPRLVVSQRRKADFR